MSKTVSLDPPEWKTLALTGVQQLGTFYSNIPDTLAPTPENLQQINAQLDRMRTFALAWHLSLRPPPAVIAKQQQRAAELHPVNVAQAPSDIPGDRRNKGGRPRGSKNKPKVRQVKNGVGVQT